MLLYCRGCNTNHRITEGEAERLVYVLAAMQADARCEVVNRADAGKDPYTIDHSCLVDLLGDSHDSEMYGEWVDGEVRARLHHQKHPEIWEER